MNDILQKDFIKRKGIAEFNKRKEVLNGEGFERWKSMILNDPNYNIILYIVDDRIAAFVCYIPEGTKACIAEIQIIEEYQGKDNTLRKLLRKMLDEIKDMNIDTITGAISENNYKSRAVFTHIGMINTNGLWFEIPLIELDNWINKYNQVEIERKNIL